MTPTALDIPSLHGKVSEEEWAVRVDLAACYRLLVRFGWEDLTFTHITMRVPGADDQFLINPYGLFFDEITASSLVKIDLQGKKIGDSPFPVNQAGFVIHSAIHAARHDARCVLHTHTVSGIAVSTQRAGLLPISQHAMSVIPSLGYHDFEGIATRDDEVVTPTDSQFLSGTNVTNIYVQDKCSRDAAEHIALAFDHIALREVLNALDPAHPAAAACTPVAPIFGG